MRFLVKTSIILSWAENLRNITRNEAPLPGKVVVIPKSVQADLVFCTYYT